jgi:hypothetical protein
MAEFVGSDGCFGISGGVNPRSVCKIRVYNVENVGIWDIRYSKSPDIRAPKTAYINILGLLVHFFG